MIIFLDVCNFKVPFHFKEKDFKDNLISFTFHWDT